MIHLPHTFMQISSTPAAKQSSAFSEMREIVCGPAGSGATSHPASSHTGLAVPTGIISGEGNSTEDSNKHPMKMHR